MKKPTLGHIVAMWVLIIGTLTVCHDVATCNKQKLTSKDSAIIIKTATEFHKIDSEFKAFHNSRNVDSMEIINH